MKANNFVHTEVLEDDYPLSMISKASMMQSHWAEEGLT